MIGIHVGVYIIFFAPVITVYSPAKLAVLLAVVVAASVQVVYLETYARVFVDIAGKIGPYAVFPILLPDVW